MRLGLRKWNYKMSVRLAYEGFHEKGDPNKGGRFSPFTYYGIVFNPLGCRGAGDFRKILVRWKAGRFLVYKEADLLEGVLEIFKI